MVFVTCELSCDLFYLKINGFSGLVVEHICVKFDDPSGFFLRYAEKQTYKHH